MTGTLAISQAALKPAAVANRAGTGVPSLTAKSTPLSADQILLWSDADSATRKLSFSDLLATIGVSGLTDNRVVRADGTNGVQSSGITIDDSNNITGVNDLTIGGDLTVNGTLTTLDTANLTVEDPLIKLAKDNVADTLDIGLYGRYNDGTDKYGGLFRDASDGVFKLFYELEDEPTTTVDTGGTGYALATLHLGTLKAGNLQAAAGGESAPAYSFSGDPDTGLYNRAANQLGISLGGTEIAYFASTAFVFQNSLPEINMRDTDTGATGIKCVFRAYGNNGAAEDIQFAAWDVDATDITDGSEDGSWRFWSTVAGSLSLHLSIGGNKLNLASGVALAANGTQVVTSRQTGWGAPTGTETRSTFATSTVTLEQLAERVHALIDDLTTHGLIGT